jgi:hypothetical protein
MTETDFAGVRPITAEAEALRPVLHELDRRLHAKFGDDYLRIILFGSRARGDHRPDSDVDVAVVMRADISNRWKSKRAIIGVTYPLLLETGLYIQPWPVSQTELDDPAKSTIAPLLRSIIREGVAM